MSNVIVANTKGLYLTKSFLWFFKFLGNIAQNLYSAVRRMLSMVKIISGIFV